MNGWMSRGGSHWWGEQGVLCVGMNAEERRGEEREREREREREKENMLQINGRFAESACAHTPIPAEIHLVWFPSNHSATLNAHMGTFHAHTGTIQAHMHTCTHAHMYTVYHHDNTPLHHHHKNYIIAPNY